LIWKLFCRLCRNDESEERTAIVIFVTEINRSTNIQLRQFEAPLNKKIKTKLEEKASDQWNASAKADRLNHQRISSKMIPFLNVRRALTRAVESARQNTHRKRKVSIHSLHSTRLHFTLHSNTKTRIDIQPLAPQSISSSSFECFHSLISFYSICRICSYPLYCFFIMNQYIPAPVRSPPRIDPVTTAVSTAR